MKDKEWLKDEVARIYDTRDYWSVDDLRDEILDLINELDELEVLLREETINMVLDDLKEHIEEQQSLSQNVGMAHTPAGNDTHYRQYDYVLECINEYEPSDDLHNLIILKQELPVIPKYVADYLEKAKADIDLMRVMDIAYNHSERDKFNKHYDWIRENHELFAEAWLNGYVVEKEKLYRIEMPETDDLLLTLEGSEYYFHEPLVYIGEKPNFRQQFAESEIKAIDERYWLFAEPVDELEE